MKQELLGVTKAVLLLLILIALASVLQIQPTSAKASPSHMGNIVAIATQIYEGKGNPINGWVGNQIVPYQSQGGHYRASPGPNIGGQTTCESGEICGVDCSGFTRWVYYLAYKKDVLGAGGTSVQINHLTKDLFPPGGHPVDGDLVFFAHKDGVIFHVGVYIGNGNMIDAPGTGRDLLERPISNLTKYSNDSVAGYYYYALR